MNKQSVIAFLMFSLVGACCVARLVSLLNTTLPKF